MTTLRLVGIGIGAIALVGALLIAALLIVYRPTIEYAYVDLVDSGKGSAAGWWLLGLGALAASLIVIFLKRLRTRAAK